MTRAMITMRNWQLLKRLLNKTCVKNNVKVLELFGGFQYFFVSLQVKTNKQLSNMEQKKRHKVVLQHTIQRNPIEQGRWNL